MSLYSFSATASLAALVLWISVLPARAADVYVAFDEHGVAHFAERALDDRYQLFFRDLQAKPAAPVGGRSVAAPNEIRAELVRAADRHGLDYALLHAVAQAESGFNTGAVSPKGAVGLMQLMPATARRYGVPGSDAAALNANLRLTSLNVEAGSRYLRDLLRQFGGRTELALAAYNAGEGAVRRAGNRIPNYPETQNYVRKVMGTLGHLQAGAGRQPAAGTFETASRDRASGSGVSVQMFKGEEVEVQRFESGFAGQASPH